MQQPSWLVPSDQPSRRSTLLRLLIVTALIGASLALWQHVPRSSPLNPRWRTATDPMLLQADVMFRGGEALRRIHGAEDAYVIDIEEAQQTAIGLYERLALRASDPNVDALYRLAIVYARQGYPAEAVKLLGRLVQLDETRTPLYLAVSAVYDTGPTAAGNLPDAEGILADSDDWPTRLALTDFFRRIHNDDQAAAAVASENRSDYVFFLVLCILGSVYLLLGLVGAAMVARHLWRWLVVVRPATPAPNPSAPMPGRWGIMDVAEVVAALIFATVLTALISGALASRMTSGTSTPLAAPLYLVSYVLIIGSALWVIRHRAQAGAALAAVLGISGRPTWTQVFAGLRGYCALVAIFAAWVALTRGLGVTSPLPAAQTSGDLIRQSHGIFELLIYFVVTCGMAPLAEEIIFRGFIYPGLRVQLRPTIAMLGSAALFGATHLSLAPGGMVSVAVVGVLLAWLYERYRSLWPCVAAHALHNLLAFTLIAAMSS